MKIQFNDKDTNAIISKLVFLAVMFMLGSGYAQGMQSMTSLKGLPTSAPMIQFSPSPEPTQSPTPTPSPSFSGWCFLAGTRVSSPQGDIMIELLQVGDSVYAIDPETGERFEASVSGIWKKEEAGYLDVRTDDGSAVLSTASHPFYDVRSGDFLELGRFETGDILMQSGEHGAYPVRIIQMDVYRQSVTVYHLTVDHSLHTFSANGFIVHNKTPTVTPSPQVTFTPTPHPTITSTFTSTPSITPTMWCFLKGTRVLSPLGEIPIERLSVGDQVYAVNPINGERFEASVTEMWIKQENGFLDISSEDGNDVRVTRSHPFYDIGTGEFLEIGQFDVGDKLVRSESDRVVPVEITRIDQHSDIVTVYHLTVDHPLHTFIADGYIVHNKSATPSAVPSRTPTATCPPCAPFIHSEIVSMDDTVGDCSDADGNLDAGESARLIVSFVKTQQCEIYDCSVNASVDNPKVTISPAHVDQSCDALVDESFILTMSPAIECEETVIVTIQTITHFCGSTLPYATDYSFLMEIDGTVPETHCDEMPCESNRIELNMSDTDLRAGDLFRLSYQVFNTSPDAVAYDLWILLGIGEDYWFYPSWTYMSEGLDYESDVQISANSSVSKTVLDFPWPADAGVIEGARFVGAICRQGTYEIVNRPIEVTWQAHACTSRNPFDF